ncbi:MAG: hypothetical protein WCJ24_02350 [Candidatus Saccharibacteria bacterium]
MKELLEFFYDFRCDCGRLLFKSPGFVGKIEVKCRRCGQLKMFKQTLQIAKAEANINIQT